VGQRGEGAVPARRLAALAECETECENADDRVRHALGDQADAAERLDPAAATWIDASC
jgi:hypothetical protein